jgi:hypothetical protein
MIAIGAGETVRGILNSVRPPGAPALPSPVFGHGDPFGASPPAGLQAWPLGFEPEAEGSREDRVADPEEGRWLEDGFEEDSAPAPSLIEQGIYWDGRATPSAGSGIPDSLFDDLEEVAVHGSD